VSTKSTTKASAFTAILWWLVAALSLLIASYGLRFALSGERMYSALSAASFRARSLAIHTHALFGALMLLLGPWQLRRKLRERRLRLHRRLGQAYVVCCLLAGSTGLYLAFYSYGGWPTHTGFGLLALALLGCTLSGYREILAGRRAEHRAWMIRSFALAFAAVTLRFELSLLQPALGGFAPAYNVVAWLCWVPNLLFAELYLRRTKARATALPH
jgi:hypothetical protein